jgi:hypothetical protein
MSEGMEEKWLINIIVSLSSPAHEKLTELPSVKHLRNFCRRSGKIFEGGDDAISTKI